MMRAYNKALPVIAKEESGVTPRFYVRCLVELEDFISEMWEDREGRKNMSKNNSKSLTSMRQKLRKYNKDFEEDIAKFRENPDQPDDEEEEEKRKLFKIISVYIHIILIICFTYQPNQKSILMKSPRQRCQHLVPDLSVLRNQYQLLNQVPMMIKNLTIVWIGVATLRAHRKVLMMKHNTRVLGNVS